MPRADRLEPGNPDGRYAIIVGGVTVLEDGKLLGVLGPTGYYGDMSLESVLQYEEMLATDPEAKAALQAAHEAVLPFMTKLGRQIAARKATE